MKLASTKSKTSFYETFSDLIFATMAIFVLLMTIFLVQVNATTGLEELLDEVENRTAKRDEITENISAQQNELSKMEKAAQSLDQYNLEVVIAVDTTGSMQLELNRLTETIAMIGSILPKIAHSVKMGVIAYRRDENDNLDIKRFPMQVIRDEKLDGGRSYRSLYNFVRRLKAKAGSAPFEIAVDEALKMFTRSADHVGHQTLMLLGDVGPYEDRYRDQKIDSINLQQENAIISQLRIWTDKSLTRNMLVLFSGDDEISKTSGEQHEKFIASRKFFQRIAADVGQPDAFTADSAEMMPKLLSAALD